MKASDKWLYQYEKLRTDPYGTNESWVSDKYDIVGLHWTEIQQIYVEDLGMTWGQACSALKKSWNSYKRARSRGEGTYNTRDIALRILRIQHGLGIPQSEFPDLDKEWVDHELSLEEMEAKREEQQEEEDNDEDWGIWEEE